MIMKHKKLLAFSIACCLLKATTGLAASEPPSSELDLQKAIQKINNQTADLEKEIRMLKAELRQVKQTKIKKSQPSASESQAASTVNNSTQQANKIVPSNTFLGIQRFVASPVLNVSLPSHSLDLDPSGFLSYQSGMAQGLFYLQQRKALEDQEKTNNLPGDDRPQVMLGGKLEAQASLQNPYVGTNTNNIDLVTAELEVLTQASPWVNGVFIIDYNNASLNQVLQGSGNPINNSNLFLNRGYITLGNLNQSPVYFNVGQMYAPFGTYGGWTLTNSTTKVLGRAIVRAAELGFVKDGFNTSVYAFNGGPTTSFSNNQINNWGTDASYKFNFGQYNADLGVGFINDIASAQGAQLTGGGAGTFQGFSQNGSTETLVRYVPGVDLSGSLARGPWYFVAEGVAATRAYDPADMSFDAKGAQPKAAHIETGLDFNLLGKKSVFSVSYDQTWQALAMGLPKNSYIATFNTSIWKNTVETLEVRHDMNYASTNTSTGACIATDSVGNAITICPGPLTGGGSQNTILAQLGVYF